MKLKKNLIENDDYFVISHLMWKFFYNMYGGIEI